MRANMKKNILAILLFLPVLIHATSKQDELAAENASLRTQLATEAKQRDALAQAVSKGNSNAAQRSATSVTATDANAADAQRAVAAQIVSADRIERKAEEAKSSADDAARVGQSNTSMLYISIAASFSALFGVIFQTIMKFVGDGRQHAWQIESDIAARAHAAEVVQKLNQNATDMNTLKVQTNGMSERLAAVSKAQGHAEGILDERNDPGKTGD